MPSSVSIVIPTWNGRPLLERFLPSVMAAATEYQRQSAQAAEVVIVDDGSTDDTGEWVERRAAASPVALRLVRHARNLGFGAAANRGMQDAGSPLVWLLNNDVEVPTDGAAWLASAFDEDADGRLLAVHSRMADAQTNADVGTGKMGGFSRGFLRVHRSFVPEPGASGPFWSMFATGGSAMFRRALFLDLGGFDPIFAPFYMEDVELSYRAWKRGLSVRYEPRCVVLHQFSSTIAPLAGRRIERISQRNRLMFQWIHLHDRPYVRAHAFWVLVLIVTAPLTFKFGFVRGFIDAVRSLPAVRTRRKRERTIAVRSDRDVLQTFADMAGTGRIRAYDDPRELV